MRPWHKGSVTRRATRRATLVATLAVSTVALAGGDKKAPPGKKDKTPPPAAKDTGPRMEPDDLPGPQPEVAKNPAKVEVPPIPDFELPVAEAGFHGPRELRVHGQSLLGTEIKVRGYITWIYDCATALAATNPKATRPQILKAINKDPTLCDRPKFYLGDAKATAREASIWVVDVPRPPTKAERGNLKPSELKGLWPEVPRLALGDYVMVTGTWALYSPHDEHNTGGLLVYKALEHVAPPAAPPGNAPASSPSEPEVAVVTKPPLRKAVGEADREASVGHLNACNKAIAARQYDAGITACEAAVKAWDGNHLAWYARASAHMAKSEWQNARDAVEHAVALRPDHAMYQLYHGISLYEAERERVRDEQARQENKKPEDVVIDASRLKLDAARDALRRAVKLGPDLWRGHYYLGRVYRDLDDVRRQAEQFSATISTHPSYRFGYIALIELYRHWDYIDQALAVARLGTANVAPSEVGELWFEVGMAHDARREDDKAIEAFGKAIAANPGDLSSKFQRGQIYFRRNDYPNAQRDLGDVVKANDPRTATTRPLASQMLKQMADKQR